MKQYKKQRYRKKHATQSDYGHRRVDDGWPVDRETNKYNIGRHDDLEQQESDERHGTHRGQVSSGNKHYGNFTNSKKNRYKQNQRRNYPQTRRNNNTNNSNPHTSRNNSNTHDNAGNHANSFYSHQKHSNASHAMHNTWHQRSNPEMQHMPEMSKVSDAAGNSATFPIHSKSRQHDRYPQNSRNFQHFDTQHNNNYPHASHASHASESFSNTKNNNGNHLHYNTPQDSHNFYTFQNSHDNNKFHHHHHGPLHFYNSKMPSNSQNKHNHNVNFSSSKTMKNGEKTPPRFPSNTESSPAPVTPDSSPASIAADHNHNHPHPRQQHTLPTHKPHVPHSSHPHFQNSRTQMNPNKTRHQNSGTEQGSDAYHAHNAHSTHKGANGSNPNQTHHQTHHQSNRFNKYKNSRARMGRNRYNRGYDANASNDGTAGDPSASLQPFFASHAHIVETQDYDDTEYMQAWRYNSSPQLSTPTASVPDPSKPVLTPSGPQLAPNASNAPDVSKTLHVGETPKSSNISENASETRGEEATESKREESESVVVTELSDDLAYDSVRLFVQFFECATHSDAVLTDAVGQLELILRRLPLSIKYDLLGCKAFAWDLRDKRCFAQLFEKLPKTMKFVVNKFHQRSFMLRRLQYSKCHKSDKSDNSNDSKSANDGILKLSDAEFASFASEDATSCSAFSPLVAALRHLTSSRDHAQRRGWRGKNSKFGETRRDANDRMRCEQQADIWVNVILFLMRKDFDLACGGNCDFFRCVYCKDTFDVYNMYHRCMSAASCIGANGAAGGSRRYNAHNASHGTQHMCGIKLLVSSILRVGSQESCHRNEIVLHRCYKVLQAAVETNGKHGKYGRKRCGLPIGRIEIKEGNGRAYARGYVPRYSNKFHTILRHLPGYEMLRQLLMNGCVPFRYIKFDVGEDKYNELTDDEIERFCGELPDFWENIPMDWGMILLNVYHDIYDEKVYKELWKMNSELSKDVIELILEFVWNSDYEKHFPKAYTFDLDNVKNCLEIMETKKNSVGYGVQNKQHLSMAVYESWVQYFDKKRKYRKLRRDEKQRDMIEKWKLESEKQEQKEETQSAKDKDKKNVNDEENALKLATRENGVFTDSALGLVPSTYPDDQEFENLIMSLRMDPDKWDSEQLDDNDNDNDSFGILSPKA